MATYLTSGRIIGALLLAQGFGGYFVNVVLLMPMFAAPGFLVNAAEHPLRMGVAAVLGIATGALMPVIAIVAWPVFRRRSEAMAVGFVAVSAACLALSAVEYTTVMSLLSLSQAFAQAGVDGAALFEVLRGVVAAARRWAHFINLAVAGATILFMYVVLFRFTLVPRPLAVFGMTAALSQMAGVGAPIFGHPVIFPMLLPLGLAQLALTVWLLARGFQPQPAAEANTCAS